MAGLDDSVSHVSLGCRWMDRIFASTFAMLWMYYLPTYAKHNFTLRFILLPVSYGNARPSLYSPI